jgi:tRNA threonylcarbamoyladenosine biosynthesis protein TsaB
MYPALAIDCTDEVSSIAVSDGDNLWQVENGGEKRQARKILSLVDQCLDKAGRSKEDLRSICWAAGPGSFTGLRVATAVSQGLAYALQLPLIAVSSLEALANSVAQNYPETEGPILVISDAFMGEYYWATFELNSAEGAARLSPDSLSTLEEIQLPDHLALVVGNSADKIETDASVKKVYHSPMRAEHLFGIANIRYKAGEQISAMHAEPLYLRSKAAWNTLEQQKKKEPQVM